MGTLPVVFTQETRLTLRPNVLFVMLRDMDTGLIHAKLISVNGRKTWKPNNDIAALLLYLLAREPNDPIHYSEFADLAKQKFDGATDTGIQDFLNELNQDKILNVTEGKMAADDLDPVHLFDPPQVTWDTPHLVPGEEPIIRGQTFFTTGYGAWSIPR